MDRSWMYDRLYPGRAGLKRRFVEGVEEFVLLAKRQKEFEQQGGIRCPCSKCIFRSIKNEGDIRFHLYNNGFKPNYWIWTRHGEVAAGVSRVNINNVPPVDIVPVQEVEGGTSSPVVEAVGSSTMGNQSFDVVQGMIRDAIGVNLDFEEPQYDAEEVSNEEAQRFYMFLSETNQPLFEGSNESKLSMCVRLLGLKSQFNVAELCMEYMTKMMLDATPIRGLLPQSYYDAKRLVSKLGLKSKRIYCCVSGCMLYYSNEFGINDGELSECKLCGEPRYRASRKGTSRGKPVPRKAMFYPPLIPRLQRMFTSKETAGKMSWHYENRNNSGGMGRRSFPSSIVPNFRSNSSSTTSTGRSHVPTPEERAEVAVLTEKLSNYEREIREMREQQAEERRLAAEERRINEEFMKQVMDSMAHARPSMPSSSSSVPSGPSAATSATSCLPAAIPTTVPAISDPATSTTTPTAGR